MGGTALILTLILLANIFKPYHIVPDLSGVGGAALIQGQTKVNENGGSPNWFLTSKTLSTHKGASFYTFG